jgi:hypothetical protein
MDAAISSLPLSLRWRIFSFVPAREFVLELGRDCSTVCVWCGLAFNRNTYEFITCFPMKVFDEAGRVDVELGDLREITNVVHVCSACTHSRECSRWIDAEIDLMSTSGPTGVFMEFPPKLLAQRPAAVHEWLAGEWGRSQMGAVYFVHGADHGIGWSGTPHQHVHDGACDSWRPAIRGRAAQLSLARIVYLYGWTPWMWPTWLRGHPFTAHVARAAPRGHAHPCILQWPARKLALFPDVRAVRASHDVHRDAEARARYQQLVRDRASYSVDVQEIVTLVTKRQRRT